MLTTNDKPRHVHVARVAVHFGLEGLHSLDRGIVPAEVVNVGHGYVELAHGRSAGIQRSGGNITRNFWGGGKFTGSNFSNLKKTISETTAKLVSFGRTVFLWKRQKFSIDRQIPDSIIVLRVVVVIHRLILGTVNLSISRVKTTRHGVHKL